MASSSSSAFQGSVRWRGASFCLLSSLWQPNLTVTSQTRRFFPFLSSPATDNLLPAVLICSTMVRARSATSLCHAFAQGRLPSSFSELFFSRLSPCQLLYSLSFCSQQCSAVASHHSSLTSLRERSGRRRSGESATSNGFSLKKGRGKQRSESVRGRSLESDVARGRGGHDDYTAHGIEKYGNERRKGRKSCF